MHVRGARVVDVGGARRARRDGRWFCRERGVVCMCAVRRGAPSARVASASGAGVCEGECRGG